MVGRTIAEYRILSRLGKGAMGEVFLALDTRLGRKVAFKVLPAEVSQNRERLARFEREARAVAALNHPNIVTLHAVGEAEGIHFLTMEHVEGRSLAEAIPPGGMAPADALAVAAPLADAFAAVHERGITHRDLKPQNVMVTNEGRVKVLDFGLASLRADASEDETASEGALTEDGRVMGTPAYMSPEQAMGRPADARSDIFAFGALLHEMLTGARPFGGSSVAEVMSAVIRESPLPVSTRNPEVPPALERIVRRCLEKDPRRRYQSALDLKNDLEDISFTGRGGERRPRRAAAVAIGAVVITAILAVAAVWYRGGWGAAPDRPIESLAVLPFDNLMNDPDQDYFVEGMHETLITALSGVRSVRVISRTSVMRFRGSERPLPEIAGELGVDALVEGSVLRVGDRVRVTAQLIDGTTDEHLWAASYDRDVRDVFALTSEVAGAIAGEIAAALTPQQQARLARVIRVDPEALDTYLKARYHLNRLTADGSRQGLALAVEATRIDPGFAAAHALTGGAHFLMAITGAARPREVAPAILASAERSLVLDDQLAFGYGVRGIYRLYLAWDWEGARVDLERALELGPNEDILRHGYADYLTVMGRRDEAVDQLRIAQRNDPFSAMTNLPVVAHLVLAHRYDEAIAEGRAVLTRLPDARVRGFIGRALWEKGLYEEALAEDRIPLAGRPSPFLDAQERGFAEGGPQGAMRAAAAFLAERARSAPVEPLDVASAWASAGDADRMFEWLDRAFEARSLMLVHIRAAPEYDPYRADPRFVALARRIGFPE